MDFQLLDLYSDYLISSFSYTTATGLSRALGGAISHDTITRFLAEKEYDSRQLWKLVKKTVRKIQSSDGIIIVDDTIEEKPYTDESELVCWHHDHTVNRNVKGINILSNLYLSRGITIPTGFQTIRKTEVYKDEKTGRERRKSIKTKNEYFRDMTRTAVIDNQIPCRFIVADSWFSSNDNMEHVVLTLKKDFVFPLKTNRLVCQTIEEKRKGTFQRVDTLKIQEDTANTIYIKELPFPVVLVKQIFTNEDGESGMLYLVCSNLTVDGKTIEDVYQKRWPIEIYHKSLKSNINLEKSPTRTQTTQNNHIFASIYGYFKLELLKLKTGFNHFALKAKLYLQALQASMGALKKLQLVT